MSSTHQCQECRASGIAPGEYHPYLFCVLVKAGYTQARIRDEILAAAREISEES